MVTSHAMGNKPASIHGGVGSGSGRAERFGGRKRDASLKGPSRSRTDWSGSLSARWATNFNARAGNPPLRALCLVALREPGVRRAPLKMPIALVDFGVPVTSPRDGLHFFTRPLGGCFGGAGRFRPIQAVVIKQVSPAYAYTFDVRNQGYTSGMQMTTMERLA